MRSEHVEPKGAPGWYPDSEQPNTQRYWDGGQWTDQRAPLIERSQASPSVVPRIVIAGLGAAIAVLAVFLPVAEASIEAVAGEKLHISANSLIQHPGGPLTQHPEGIVVIIVALSAFLAAFQPQPVWRAFTFVAGGVLIGLAVDGGLHPPLQAYCSFFGEVERCPGLDVNPAAGIWTLGTGGVLIALSAFAGVDGRFDKERWSEIMQGAGKEGQ